MGMLLYMMDMERKDKAAGATKKVAPKPPIKETKPEIDAKVEEAKDEPTPTPNRSDIMKMNVATVREYAEKQGVKGANAMSGAELKRILCNKLFEESE